MGYKIHYSNELAHSKGPWKKHKYLKKVGNKYVYANTESGANKSGPATNPYNSGRKYGRLAASLVKKFNAFKMSAMAAIGNYISNGKKFVSAFVAQYKASMNPSPHGPISANAVGANGPKIRKDEGDYKPKPKPVTGPSSANSHHGAVVQNVQDKPKEIKRGHVNGKVVKDRYSGARAILRAQKRNRKKDRYAGAKRLQTRYWETKSNYKMWQDENKKKDRYAGGRWLINTVKGAGSKVSNSMKKKPKSGNYVPSGRPGRPAKKK